MLNVTLEGLVYVVDWVQARYMKLVNIDEKKLQALHHSRKCQQKIERAFNLKVHPRNIKVGNAAVKAIRVPHIGL